MHRQPLDRTPVLVGVGRLTQRVEEPGGGMDAVDLMAEAVQHALDDAGAPGLGPRVQLIAAPRGTWRCTDPCRVIAERIGARSARTIVAEVGVLQQSLLTHACELIASGAIEAAIVCGAEAKYRAVVASRAGVAATDQPGPESEADEVWRPDGQLVTAFDFERGIVMPAVQYALIESAHAGRGEWTVEERRRRLGELWSGYASVAATDPLAWDRSDPGADAIAGVSDDNRMVAFPYTRLLCSQWNVDQAAALLLSSASLAQQLGIDPQRCVYPVAATEANAMIPMPQRREIHRWPTFRIAAARALELANTTLDDIDLLEIYSCFPSAVQVQMSELALTDARPLTVTGGMTFGGGPLNNFVLQSTVSMAQRLRDGSGATTGQVGQVGMVTSVSGLLTKPGVAIWSSISPKHGFRSIDVTAEALQKTPTCPMSTQERGTATVIGSTVSYVRDEQPRAIAVLELTDGSRTVASTDVPDDIELFTTTDPVGQRVNVLMPGVFAG